MKVYGGLEINKPNIRHVATCNICGIKISSTIPILLNEVFRLHLTNHNKKENHI